MEGMDTNDCKNVNRNDDRLHCIVSRKYLSRVRR